MCNCQKDLTEVPIMSSYEAMVRKAEKDKCQCENCTCEKTALEVQIEGTLDIFKGNF